MGDDGAIPIPIPNRRRGSSILLSLKPRFTDSRNSTTAEARSKDGYIMAVSLWVADPPQLSLLSIHRSNPEPQHTEPCNFRLRPHVVGADGPFVLLRAAFVGSWPCEYFLYKAGHSPSLQPIPPCPRDDQKVDDLRDVKELGIVGHGHGHGQGYLLAALRDAPNDAGYQLRIYSSETKSWSTRTLPNPCPGVDRVIPDKVITLGGGLLGWVDLSLGILVCDLLLLLAEQQQQQQHQDQDQPPATDGRASCFFIPLPEPLPGNKYPVSPTQKKKEPSPSSSWFRDLTCISGVLMFIEMEKPLPSENKIIYDSDLILSLKRKAQQLSCFRDAWRAVTWTRKLGSSSSNCWRQICAAHVADIKEGQQLRDFYSAFPILSPAEEDGDMDVLYLRSLLEPSDRDGSVLALDIGNKSLKAIGRYYLPDDFYYNLPYDPRHPFRACTLSRHLDMTDPGIQVSECRKITEASSSSANQPSETKIDLASCKASTILKVLREKVAEVRRELKTSSRVHPAENNLPQPQCVNKWDNPPGHPLSANQNSLPPQQRFNFIRPVGPGYASSFQPPQQRFNFVRPVGPGYASLAPVHGCHNYQPLWPPSKQQLTSGPHEAPQPGFYYSNGASYNGYPQQLPAHNPFAFGAHTGFGNYQQQCHQFPSSWQQQLPLAHHLTREDPSGRLMRSYVVPLSSELFPPAISGSANYVSVVTKSMMYNSQDPSGRSLD